jgi:hypothetical protein
MDTNDLMIQDCEERKGQLSDWERGFIASLAEQRGAGRTLSERQEEGLTAIWDRVTS